jgi:hypothetical protein
LFFLPGIETSDMTLGSAEQITSKHPGQSHKRTLSNGPEQKVVEDTSVTTSSVPPPPNKKAKPDPQSESLESSDSESDIQIYGSDDEGEDLISLAPDGANIFFGFGDGLIDVMDTGGEDLAPFWFKPMVMDTYATMNKEDRLPCVCFSCSSKDRQFPQAKLLKSHFLQLGGDWWYELTLTREMPEGNRLRVNVNSGYYHPMGDQIYGGIYMGKWWISDIKVAEAESKKAVEAVHSKMV